MSDPCVDQDSTGQNSDLQKKWGFLALIGFRFAFSYFTLFFFDAFITSLLRPFMRISGAYQLIELYSKLWSKIVAWFGNQILHLPDQISYNDWPTADDTYGWVRTALLLLIAFGATLAWSIFDRKCENYERLQVWFRLFLRINLSQALITYGMGKVIKTQFEDISLKTLLQPIGEQSPMGLLWHFMGFSPVYCQFAGWAEVIPALLLLVPRLTLLGALIAAAVMTNVFVMNVFYDVRVKLYSLHLLLISPVLIAPDAKRLVDLFLLNRPVEKSRTPMYFKNVWLNRLVLILPALLAVSALWDGAAFGIRITNATRVHPAHYGIWEVDEFKQDDKILLPLKAESSRWKYLIFDDPDYVNIKFMNDMVWQIYKETDEHGNLFLGSIKNDDQLIESKRRGKKFKAVWVNKEQLTVGEPAKDQLLVEGKFNRHDCQVKLHRIDEKEMPLLKQGFRWVTNPRDYTPH